jgi:hypothetical protein
MSYAPYTNDDVAAQHRAGQNPTALGLLLGQFVHKETGVRFEYSERRGFGDVWPGITQQIFVGGTKGPGVRLAIVKKTVVKVVVDEDANGHPVWESWPIKQHSQYLTDWVR